MSSSYLYKWGQLLLNTLLAQQESFVFHEVCCFHKRRIFYTEICWDSLYRLHLIKPQRISPARVQLYELWTMSFVALIKEKVFYINTDTCWDCILYRMLLILSQCISITSYSWYISCDKLLLQVQVLLIRNNLCMAFWYITSAILVQTYM